MGKTTYSNDTFPYEINTDGSFTIPFDSTVDEVVEWDQYGHEPAQEDTWYKIEIDLKNGKINIIPIKKE